VADQPKPRDTSGVRLPKEISALTEKLAKNTHENRTIRDAKARRG